MSTTPLICGPAWGEVIISLSGTQPSPPTRVGMGRGVNAIWVANSGEIVPVGVASKSSVGVARKNEAGRLGMINEAVTNSPQDRTRIKVKDAKARPMRRRANSFSRL